MNNTRLLRTLTVAAALSSVLILSACGASDDGGGSAPEAGVETEAPPAEPGIGTPVTDGAIEYVVNSVTCSTDPMEDDTFAALAPSGQFCKVNVSATALSNIGMFLGVITVSTTSEAEVTPAVGAMMYEGTLQADFIDEGQTLTGDVVFDIPVDDSITSILLKENGLTDGVTVVVD